MFRLRANFRVACLDREKVIRVRLRLGRGNLPGEAFKGFQDDSNERLIRDSWLVYEESTIVMEEREH